MSLLTTVARKGYYIIYFLLSYRAINCNLSHDKENGKLHVGKIVIPDDEIHVGWIKLWIQNLDIYFIAPFFLICLEWHILSLSHRLRYSMIHDANHQQYKAAGRA